MRGEFLSRKMAVFALSLAALAGVTWGTLRQHAPPQFEPPHLLPSAKWWLSPLERNAGLRPSFTTEDLRSVVFATPQSGWAVGRNGTILHTEDAGRTWTPQASKTLSFLDGVAFVTPQSGWMVGDNGTIIHTDDAGKTWNPQSSSTDHLLISVAFATPRSGWAVGWTGTILHTEDGGETWEPQSSKTDNDLTFVVFATPKSGWVVGKSGTILHTEDGGKTWAAQSSSTHNWLDVVTFATPQSGWAVGEAGTILHTEDGGRTWAAQPSNTQDELQGVAFATPLSGWAVGRAGTIIHTEDGGRTWAAQPSNTQDELQGVAFATPLSGWAVGDKGTILHTENGGKRWAVQSSNAQDFLISVAFANSHSGWAVGVNGIVLRTEDGGSTWTDQSSGTRSDLYSITFVTPQSGWAVGENGTILHTEDGGKTWAAQASKTQDELVGVAFATPYSGWAAGAFGIILHTKDSGKTWEAQASNATDLLTSVAFANSRSGWTGGHFGSILHTEDGGKTWAAQASNLGGSLTCFAFANLQSGWAVGENGTILRTEDGGRHWKWAGYQRWPAPWFYLAALVCCGGLTWACWPSAPPVREAIEELASSDAPVTSVKEDALGYGALVDRMRRFIQNPKTAPPLVLSLQAPWGMGKSSIMRMLETELRDRRAAVTVWFNAWHHQKEDQLLACLLEAVQKQAVPPWFSPVGLSFRFDLVRVRLFSNLDRLALTCLTLAAIATGPLWFRYLPGTLLNAPPWLKGAGLAGLVWVLLQPLLAFKSDPEKLMDRAGQSLLRTVKDLLTLPSLVGKSDVRQEFAANLKDVVEALEPQRLVIFLDDLDRCKPEQVVQILEAVNFLSSVSSCFIVVGADYQKVEALAAKEFETIAVHEFENLQALRGHEDGEIIVPDTARLRVEYARNYMRKIINLRLNLRRLEEADYREFLRRKPQEARSLRRPLQRG